MLLTRRRSLLTLPKQDPTPSSPTLSLPKLQSSSEASTRISVIIPKKHGIRQEQAANTALCNQYSYNQPSLSGNVKDSGFVIKIPPPSARILNADQNSRAAEHGTLQKQKRTPVRPRTTDQSAIADDALHRLQDIIQDIFQANDQSQQDTLGVISPADHVRLDAALQKVISHGRYDQVPIDDISRLETLCLSGLEATQGSKFEIDASSSIDEDSKWVQGLETLDLGLRSTRMVLRIMAGGRQEKEVYSEELLQNSLHVIQKVLNTTIIPIIESRSSETGSAIYEIASSHQKYLVQLVNDTKKALDLLVSLLEQVELAEGLITTVEFFATRLLFVENASSEKESILGIQRFESLRRTAMDLITEIYSRYPQQRAFLLDEVLVSLQKLPVKGQQARQYKLSDGSSIQLVSALIIRLVHTRATSTAVREGHSQQMTLDEDENSDDSEDVYQTSGETGQEVQEVTSKSGSNVSIRQLTKIATALTNSALKDANFVIRFYVSRASNAPKTGDLPHRQLLDMFVEDLITVLGFPEWPGAELLLRVLLFNMVQVSEDKHSSAPAKTMALEFLGRMGSAISELVAHTRIWARNLENHDSDSSACLGKLLEDYVEAKIEMEDLLRWEGPYHMVLDHLRVIGSDDKHVTTTRGYYLTQWANAVCFGNFPPSPSLDRLVDRLQKMMERSEWSSLE